MAGNFDSKSSLNIDYFQSIFMKSIEGILFQFPEHIFIKWNCNNKTQKNEQWHGCSIYISMWVLSKGSKNADTVMNQNIWTSKVWQPKLYKNHWISNFLNSKVMEESWLDFDPFSNRAFQSVVFNSGQKVALRAIYVVIG